MFGGLPQGGRPVVGDPGIQAHRHQGMVQIIPDAVGRQVTMASFPQSGPREYRRSFSNWWWLGRRNYLIFILREFSSIFVAYFLVVTLEQVCALARGPAA